MEIYSKYDKPCGLGISISGERSCSLTVGGGITVARLVIRQHLLRAIGRMPDCLEMWDRRTLVDGMESLSGLFNRAISLLLPEHFLSVRYFQDVSRVSALISMSIRSVRFARPSNHKACDIVSDRCHAIRSSGHPKVALIAPTHVASLLSPRGHSW